MSLDRVFHTREPAPDGAAQPRPVPASEPVALQRVDLLRVLTGLRHLVGSPEPGRVFSELAAVCVTAFCDEMVIDVTEDGGHRYRIRRPGTAFPRETPGAAGAGDPEYWSGPGTGEVTVTGSEVTVRVGSLPGGGPAYTARLVCRWHGGYLPTETDAALVGVLADHAAAVVHRERSTGRLADPAAARQIGLALDDAQRVAASTGILMALHHLTVTQARELLTRAADRTHRSLREVADTVLRTGVLPGPRHTDPHPSAPPETHC